jgi:hypothetical protein
VQRLGLYRAAGERNTADADHQRRPRPFSASSSSGRDTVLRAIEILREEGLVFTAPRRGTYVSPDTK